MQDIDFRTLSEASLLELKNGVSLRRAAELLAPEAWASWCENHVPLLILGDPESERQREVADAARREVAQLMLRLAREGRIALKTLDPPGSPTAQWVSLSFDLLGALDDSDLSLDDSRACLPDGPELQIRVFHPAGIESAAAGPFHQDVRDARGRSPKQPAKVRVHEAWLTLPEDTKQLATSHGGKRKVALALSEVLPDLAPATIERELRRLWANPTP